MPQSPSPPPPPPPTDHALSACIRTGSGTASEVDSYHTAPADSGAAGGGGGGDGKGSEESKKASISHGAPASVHASMAAVPSLPDPSHDPLSSPSVPLETLPSQPPPPSQPQPPLASSSSSTLPPPPSEGAKKGPDFKPDQYPHHVIFVVHGMGRQLEEFGNYERNVGYLVENTKAVLQSLFHELKTDVHIIPIEWHAKLHSMVDQRMSLTSLRTVPKVRLVMNDYFADILYYFNNHFGSEIIRMIVEELNEAYSIFIAQHPDFNGKIAVYALSLGGVAMYDILTCLDDDDPSDNQKDEVVDIKKEGMTAAEPATAAPPATLLTSSSGPGTEEKKKKKRVRKQDQSKFRAVVPKLKFRPHHLFTVGSPVGAVMVMRNLEWETFHPPDDINHQNLFHPFDPLAYRIEPLIDPIFAAIPAVTLTSFNAVLAAAQAGNGSSAGLLYPIMISSLSTLSSALPTSIPGSISSFWENKVPTLPRPSIPPTITSTFSQVTQTFKAGRRWLPGGGSDRGSGASTPTLGSRATLADAAAGVEAEAGGSTGSGAGVLAEAAHVDGRKFGSEDDQRKGGDGSVMETLAAATVATYLDHPTVTSTTASSVQASQTTGQPSAIDRSDSVLGGKGLLPPHPLQPSPGLHSTSPAVAETLMHSDFSTTGSSEVVASPSRRPSIGPRRISSRVEDETMEEKSMAGAGVSPKSKHSTSLIERLLEVEEEQTEQRDDVQADGKGGIKEFGAGQGAALPSTQDKSHQVLDALGGDAGEKDIQARHQEQQQKEQGVQMEDSTSLGKDTKASKKVTISEEDEKGDEKEEEEEEEEEVASEGGKDGKKESKEKAAVKDKGKETLVQKPASASEDAVGDLDVARSPIHVGGRPTKVPYRIDHVLQETRVDQYTNEYLLGMRSHFRYWGNRDIAYHILKTMLGYPGGADPNHQQSPMDLQPEMPTPVTAPKNAKEAAEAKAKAAAAAYRRSSQQQQQQTTRHRKSFSFSLFSQVQEGETGSTDESGGDGGGTGDEGYDYGSGGGSRSSSGNYGGGYGYGYGSMGFYGDEVEDGEEDVGGFLYGYRYSDLDISSAAHSGFSSNTLYKNSPFMTSQPSFSTGSGQQRRRPSSGMGGSGGSARRRSSGASSHSFHEPSSSFAAGGEAAVGESKASGDGSPRASTPSLPGNEGIGGEEIAKTTTDGTGLGVLVVPDLARPARLHHRSSRGGIGGSEKR